MADLAVWLHDLDPYALRVGGLGITWYGLSYLLGFLVGYALIRRVTAMGAQESPWRAGEAGDLVFFVAIGAVLGGRVGYVLLYRPALAVGLRPEVPFWDLLAIHEGGMASHGGMIGALVAAWLFARRRGKRFGHLLDLAAFATPPGLFFGRIANFVNGELIGRECGSGVPWAVKFPQAIYRWSAERVREAVERAPLEPAEKVGMSVFEARRWLVSRLQAGEPDVVAAVGPMLAPRHPSQLYEALLEGLVLFAVLGVVWRRPRRPGVVAGWFCLAYGALRIAVEQFREPDHHLRGQEFAWWHITRGQWLSALLLIGGVALIAVANRRSAPRLGGWPADGGAFAPKSP